MAKRMRGSTTRPGQRPPLQRSTRPVSAPDAAAAAAAAPRPTGLTPQEEARAAELEARIVAEEAAASAPANRRRSAITEPNAIAARSTGSLAAQAADEYAYVARDVRRIAIVAGALFAVLLALYVVTSMAGIRL